MAEQEYYLRSVLSLQKSGPYISKEILKREVRNSGEELNSLLNKHRPRLEHTFHHNKTQINKLFPLHGETNIETWDLQMFIQVILNVFRDRVSREDKIHLRQLKSLRDDIMHSTAPSFDQPKFEDIQEAIHDSITVLASGFGQSVKDRCFEYLNTSATEPLDSRSAVETLKHVQITDESLDEVLKTIGDSENAVIQKIESKLKSVSGNVKATRQIIERVNGLDIHSSLTKIKVNIYERVTLQFSGPEEWRTRYENVLVKLTNEAFKRADSKEDDKEIRKHFDIMVEKVTGSGDVQFKGCTKGSIVLWFECTTYVGVLQLLLYLESQEHIHCLEQITNALKKRYQISDPFTISSNVKTECLQSILDDLRRNDNSDSSSNTQDEEIKTVQKDGDKVSCLNKEDDWHVSREDNKRYIRLELECTSKEGLSRIWKLMKGNEIQEQLDKVAKTLSKQFDEDIGLKASLNHGEFLAAVEKADSIEVTVKRLGVVKAYAWLKKDMNKTTALSVAEQLCTNDLLTQSALERIRASKQRRNTIELLLKWILRTPGDSIDVLRSFLSDKKRKQLNTLVEGRTTDLEIQEFILLNESCPRPDSTKPREKLSEKQHHILSECLGKRYAIDKLNDRLLSRNIISIREHTDIACCPSDSEEQLQQFEKTLELCSENIFECVSEILDELEITAEGLMIETDNMDISTKTYISRTRKRKSSMPSADLSKENESPNIDKKRRKNPGYNALKSMQGSSSIINNQTERHLRFTLEDLRNGSLEMQINPIDDDSWKILKAKCRSGEVKDWVVDIFEHQIKELRKEECIFKLTIYVLPKPPDFKARDNKAMVKLEDLPSICKELDDCYDVLCEELEINDDLLSLLKKEGLVNDNINDVLDNKEDREEKIDYLLKCLKHCGRRGYKVLKEFIKTSNKDLYDMMQVAEGIKTIDKKLDGSASLKLLPSTSKERVKKKVFFMATIVLSVKEEEKNWKGTGKGKGKEPTLPKPEIICQDLIDPQCFFETGEDLSDDSEKSTMLMDESWIKGEMHPKENVVTAGKRKELNVDNASESGGTSVTREDVEPVKTNEQRESIEKDTTSLDQAEDRKKLKKAHSTDHNSKT